MRLDIDALRSQFQSAQEGRQSRHSVEDRLQPSLFQYDYLALNHLSRDVRTLISEIPPGNAQRMALDVGCDKSPYRAVLEHAGFEVKTLDVTPDSGADYVGTAERTGLADESFDLVLCTQVLEHCDEPWTAMDEIHRILRPGGRVIFSVPHVWFYHPHPSDHWRFTQEGVVKLCRRAGLTPVSLLAQGGSLTTAAQVVNFLAYGVLGRKGAPLYAAVNALAERIDPILPNELFCHNFACLAERR